MRKLNNGIKKNKTYSTYINPKSDEYNKKEVKKGSIIVAKLSDYEKLKPKIKDHKRESVVVLIDKDKNLGVVYLHGIKDINGIERTKKEDAGIWLKAVKDNGEVVYVDLDIRDKDKNGKPIKQGDIFKRTRRYFNDEQMNKIENHLYLNKGRSHSIRDAIKINKEKANKKTN